MAPGDRALPPTRRPPMELDDRALPLTRAQLDIWLAQETGNTGAEWQLGLFLKIEGTVDRDALEWAIRRAIQEAEPARASIFEVDGQVYQKPIDYPDIELPFYDVSSEPNPVEQAHGIASSIQRTPMPFTGPLFRFALFRTGTDEFYLFAWGHHIVIDGTGILLVGHRIAGLYSAIVSGTPIPPAFFGSLKDLVDLELEYEASNDYLEDQAYWSKNLQAETEPQNRLSKAPTDRDPNQLSAPVELDPAIVRRVEESAEAWNVPRSSVITAACALLVRGWCAEGSEVVLDFPVTRRVRPESKTLPGMVAGIVPLVLRVAPETAVTDFCQYVDARIREALEHQRFPVHALERRTQLRGPGQLADRVSVNFLPSTSTVSFGAAAASASYSNPGIVGGFGLIFSGASEQLFLSTVGAALPFSNFEVFELAERLERVLVALTTDPTLLLSSLDLVDGAEQDHL